MSSGVSQIPKRKCVEEKLCCPVNFWRLHLQGLQDYLQGGHLATRSLFPDNTWNKFGRMRSPSKSKGLTSPLQVGNSGAWSRAWRFTVLAEPSHQMSTLSQGARLISKKYMISKRYDRRRNKLMLPLQFPEDATCLVSSRTPSIPENQFFSDPGIRRLLRFCKWRDGVKSGTKLVINMLQRLKGWVLPSSPCDGYYFERMVSNRYFHIGTTFNMARCFSVTNLLPWFDLITCKTVCVILYYENMPLVEKSVWTREKGGVC